ncbi:MAG: hypothetical protein RLZZ613_1489, partial [Pseudomonadota bacterium]
GFGLLSTCAFGRLSPTIFLPRFAKQYGSDLTLTNKRNAL